MELPDRVHDRVVAFSKSGDSLAAKGKYDEAIQVYQQAWDLLPDPREEWEAATWLLVAIGDAQFMKKDHTAAFQSFLRAMSCPGALGNPFIHLRLGELHFELGSFPKALDELTRAYMGAGDKIFQREDPKYFAFVKANTLPPA